MCVLDNEIKRNAHSKSSSLLCTGRFLVDDFFFSDRKVIFPRWRVGIYGIFSIPYNPNGILSIPYNPTKNIY